MINFRVALVYDRINKWGGAERILLTLHELFPDAPLYTSVYNKETAPWASEIDIRTSFLQNISYTRSSHEALALLMPIAFESFSFDEYDAVISVASEAAKGIITKPKTLHICYNLTPTRYLWSGYEEYFKDQFFRLMSKPAVSYLRMWDKIASNRPDFYIAISKEVQKRVQEYYGRESEVVYPPITQAFSILGSSVQLKKQKLNADQLDARRSDYFLVVSRLVPYKRVDIAIEACNELKLSLKVIGTGSEEKRLKALAGPTIEFLGTINDEKLTEYYENAQALIFPGNEDFGLVMAEAQAVGTPVIALRGGGAKEIVQDGKTGSFFNKQTVESLVHVLEKFEKSRYNRDYCITSAQRFSLKRFEKEFMNSFNKIVKEYRT